MTLTMNWILFRSCLQEACIHHFIHKHTRWRHRISFRITSK